MWQGKTSLKRLPAQSPAFPELAPGLWRGALGPQRAATGLAPSSLEMLVVLQSTGNSRREVGREDLGSSAGGRRGTPDVSGGLDRVLIC